MRRRRQASARPGSPASDAGHSPLTGPLVLLAVVLEFFAPVYKTGPCRGGPKTRPADKNNRGLLVKRALGAVRPFTAVVDDGLSPEGGARGGLPAPDRLL